MLRVKRLIVKGLHEEIQKPNYFLSYMYTICNYVYYTYSLPTLVELKRNYLAGCDSWFVQDIELN